MPEGTESSEYPSEKAQTFEEVRNVRWKKKMHEKQAAEKHSEDAPSNDFDQQLEDVRRNSESQPTDQENKDDNA